MVADADYEETADFHCMACDQVYLPEQPLGIITMPLWLYNKVFPSRGAYSKAACSEECARRFIEDDFRRFPGTREEYISQLELALRTIHPTFAKVRKIAEEE
ncbi:hypothetical protein KY363_01565 [Candidatus Woesearchaeota archaeon]|nr:hypothetical protein [Candidatus Woesearchaeota archaeon]